MFTVPSLRIGYGREERKAGTGRSLSRTTKEAPLLATYTLPPGIPHTSEKGALPLPSPGRLSWENTTSLKQKQKKNTNRSDHFGSLHYKTLNIHKDGQIQCENDIHQLEPEKQ